jgi:peptidylprolyl isomerase domain and WD repeat-containing protein 1
MYKLDPIDYGRRVAVEKEIAADPEAPLPNAIFDDSGHFLLYPTLLGVKVVNLVTNRVVKVLGRVENSERFLRIALHQGSDAHRSKKLPGGPDAKLRLADPTLAATAYGKHRVYLFTRREPEETEDAAQGRDVFNERPVGDEAAALLAAGGGGAGPSADLPRGAVIHTNRGDIWVKLFPDEVSAVIASRRRACLHHASLSFFWLCVRRPVAPAHRRPRPSPCVPRSARAPWRISPPTPRTGTTTASSSTA